MQVSIYSSKYGFERITVYSHNIPSNCLEKGDMVQQFNIVHFFSRKHSTVH